MKVSIRSYSLEFHHPFGVHGHSRTSTPAIFLRLEQDGLFGYGEACLPPYLGQNESDTLNILNRAASWLEGQDDVPEPTRLRERLAPIPGREDAGMAALDMALYDLLSKREGQSFRHWKKLPGSGSRRTAFTIALGDEKDLQAKLDRAADFQILKVKLNGDESDLDLLRTIRQAVSKDIYADLNQGFASREEALDRIVQMKELGVKLVEQPFPVSQQQDAAWLSERSPLPVLADESIRNPEDLQRFYSCFTGINIKLMKCGGIDRALEMIAFAKQKGMQVMLGCMAESSCGTSAMAQLLGYADFVDLDAPLLYRNDPFSGLCYDQGCLLPPSGAGMGCKASSRLFPDETAGLNS